MPYPFLAPVKTAELEKHLKAIEDARDDADEDRETEEFESYIKRVKKKKKRPQIDFNHLPHRNAEPTKLKPRLKREEFKSVRKASIFTPEQGYSLMHPNSDKSLAEDGYQPLPAATPVQVRPLVLWPILWQKGRGRRDVHDFMLFF